MLNDDVAIPLPDTDAPVNGEILRPSQRRRIEALQSARGVLANTPALFAGSKIDGTRSVGDLIALAEWILFGSDNRAQVVRDAPSAFRLEPTGAVTLTTDGALPSFMDLPPTDALAENDGV
jgi:hypothetical protein